MKPYWYLRPRVVQEGLDRVYRGEDPKDVLIELYEASEAERAAIWTIFTEGLEVE